MSGQKVILLIPNYGFGGAQKVLADHSQLLEGQADVLEAVFNDWDEKRVYQTPHPYKSLEVAGGGSPVQRILNFFRRIASLQRLKKEFRPDVTISHLEGADYISLLSGGKDRKVLVIHGSKIGDQNIAGFTGRIRHRLLMPWLYKKADLIITVSNAIRLEMIQHYGIAADKIQALPNFFDCKAIAAKAVQPIDPSLLPVFSGDTFKIITFARLASQKNLHVLFPLIAALKQQGLKVQLFILGDGELREPLLLQAAEQGTVWSAWAGTAPDCLHDIYFLGYQQAPHAFLKHANLYVMSSLWEGFPMALCEAMAAGIAVMAADCPTGPAEILDTDGAAQPHGIGKNGALMPMITGNADPNAQDQWIAAIRKLAADPALLRQMQLCGTERVQYYDRSVIGRKWLDAYLGL